MLTHVNRSLLACLAFACSGAVHAFTQNVVDEGVLGRFSSVALGADGLPVIAYMDTQTGALKVARCSSPACATATIATVDNPGYTESRPMIMRGADGMPVIAYYDVAAGDLKVARCDDAACTAATPRTLDATGDVGYQPSIARGSDGLPVISYYDRTNADLKVAKCVDAACAGTPVLATVDSVGNAGEFSSLAIAADGLPIVAYQHEAQGLKVAKCQDAACTGPATITIVAPGIEVGRFTSMAVGGDGLPAIGFAAPNELRVAKCADPDCTSASSSVVDAFPLLSVSLHLSLAIGTDNLPVMTYQHFPAKIGIVAKCQDPACAGPVLAAPFDTLIPSTPWIAISRDGTPVISYFKSLSSGLQVIKCATATCVPGSPAGLANFAARGRVLTGDDVMIAGLIIQGEEAQEVVIRARGPSLAQFGVQGVLPNPTMTLYSGSTVIATNDNWGTAANVAAIQASGFAPTDPNESAILMTLPPGAYTAVVSGVGGATGVGIVEVFRR